MSPRRSLALAALLLTACGRHAAPTVDRVAAWRDDLHVLVAQLAHHKHEFFHAHEADWRRAAAELDARIPSLDDAHVEVAMMRLVATLGDAHTHLRLPRTRVYPIQALWFDDGLFVTGAAPADAWAIGRKLVAIDGHPADDVIARLRPLIPDENGAYVIGELPLLLSDSDVLAGVDLAALDHATWTLADGAGTRELRLSVGTAVPVARPRTVPLRLQGPTELAYWSRYVPEQRLVYVQYNRCENDAKAGPFGKFVADTLASADQQPVDRVVIDLRNNGGGLSLLIEPLVYGLAQRPALAGRVFVLIGDRTFSSAVMNASELVTRVGARLVGTPTGGNPNGFGEITRFELPHSHIHGAYSTNLFSDDRFRGNTIPPDILVHRTSDDWFSGRDPAIDAVLAARVPAPRT